MGGLSTSTNKNKTPFPSKSRILTRCHIEKGMYYEILGKCEWKQTPLVGNESIDIILSNCVLNLVRSQDKKALFAEMYRVLKKGGRVAVSDIVSDEIVPENLRNDTDLWSGCISGAFQEEEFLQAFEEAGFYGITIEKRDDQPWQTIEGIEFRSATVTARKGKEGQCFERNQAVIYRGPWKRVEDDDHHVLKRGVPIAVCDKTFQIFANTPYREDVILIHPRKSIPLSEAEAFDCQPSSERDPSEIKGVEYKRTSRETPSRSQGGCC